mmetsp:Transcript_94601/g.304450  ORF Transcript_94601/g.304450 Transcript_94601/m.304450 type:complete len:205 (-) Transcript_94601:3-617(-)
MPGLRTRRRSMPAGGRCGWAPSPNPAATTGDGCKARRPPGRVATSTTPPGWVECGACQPCRPCEPPRPKARSFFAIAASRIMMSVAERAWSSGPHMMVPWTMLEKGARLARRGTPGANRKWTGLDEALAAERMRDCRSGVVGIIVERSAPRCLNSVVSLPMRPSAIKFIGFQIITRRAAAQTAQFRRRLNAGACRRQAMLSPVA